MADAAPPPMPAAEEKKASKREAGCRRITTKSKPKVQAASAKEEKAKPKGKGTKPKGRPKAKAKAKANQDTTNDQETGEQAATAEDPTIAPPFKLIHRWKPLEKAQCYMMGVVGDEVKQKIITNISAAMHKDFSSLMQQVVKEANDMAFKTKGDAVRRRDELLMTPAAPAEQQAASATELEPIPEAEAD